MLVADSRNRSPRPTDTALADVHESIDELAHYREHFLKLEATPPAP